ncbi:MAG TPA: FliM/FliN family flagellar motor switch protein [Terracidiphilus sp.]|nr:FliM/FliN family flagellar motor switch protein [Terracidiphilus sp.]
MSTYFESWAAVAATLFSQALAGEPELAESAPFPLAAGSFGFAARLAGDVAGRFSVLLDSSLLDSPLVGEGVDQKAGWAELLREIAEASAADLQTKSGNKCRVESFDAIESEARVSRAFQLRSGDRSWAILVRDEVRPVKAEAEAPPAIPSPVWPEPGRAASPAPPPLAPGLELLLDVELDAALRFGCREMPLGDILELGPGDVVQLDRNVTDPVDLVIGDKIVARGEVVLVDGNFGLRVTEVASPRKRLESIRCLF